METIYTLNITNPSRINPLEIYFDAFDFWGIVGWFEERKASYNAEIKQDHGYKFDLICYDTSTEKRICDDVTKLSVEMAMEDFKNRVLGLTQVFDDQIVW